MSVVVVVVVVTKPRLDKSWTSSYKFQPKWGAAYLQCPPFLWFCLRAVLLCVVCQHSFSLTFLYCFNRQCKQWTKRWIHRRPWRPCRTSRRRTWRWAWLRTWVRTHTHTVKGLPNPDCWDVCDGCGENLVLTRTRGKWKSDFVIQCTPQQPF